MSLGSRESLHYFTPVYTHHRLCTTAIRPFVHLCFRPYLLHFRYPPYRCRFHLFFSRYTLLGWLDFLFCLLLFVIWPKQTGVNQLQSDLLPELIDRPPTHAALARELLTDLPLGVLSPPIWCTLTKYVEPPDYNANNAEYQHMHCTFLMHNSHLKRL